MTDSIAEPRAELTPGSILRLAPIAQTRMVGPTWFVFGYQLGGLALGLLVGEFLLGLIPVAVVIEGKLTSTWPAVDAVPVICGVIGWSLGLRLAQARHQQKFLAGIRRRGTPDKVEVSYAIAGDGLRIITSRLEYRVTWDAILELVPSPEGWLIQVDMITFQLPKRAFADPPDERAFVRSILDRLRPEARERSREAVTFVDEA